MSTRFTCEVGGCLVSGVEHFSKCLKDCESIYLRRVVGRRGAAAVFKRQVGAHVVEHLEQVRLAASHRQVATRLPNFVAAVHIRTRFSEG
jgi:hypothetical protein